ncbi:hypothetical protein BH23THE1_BH23THE1_14300 [soil metagenome]
MIKYRPAWYNTMVDESMELDQVSTKKKISQPPLNLLFNPSLIERNDVWKINIVKLLEVLLSTLNKSSYKDLRVCGVAILTSTLIHRLKVESIFRLEKIANKDQQGVSERDKEFSERVPIPEISNLTLPFRKELSYPVSLEDLISILETMITDLTNPVVRRSSLNLEPVEVIDFQHYLIKFEKIIEEFENRIMTRLRDKGELNFNEMMIGLDRIDIARYFIAMLYLSMKDKIEIITGFTDLNMGIEYLDSSPQAMESVKTIDNVIEWIRIAPKK